VVQQFSKCWQLTASIWKQLNEQEAARWERNPRLSNAEILVQACYAAHPNKPILCADVVKTFTDAVNELFLGDLANKQ